MVEVGASFPPNGPANVDLDQAKCYGEAVSTTKREHLIRTIHLLIETPHVHDQIFSAADANPKFPRQYEIDIDARYAQKVCGDNVYSFNIESNDVSGSETYTGLSLYYYATQSDWEKR